ncbi:MAG: DUF4832 domain-containing protein [Clostridia bacterium]|nr:DUF4832 domain-containing protein [Clostridia bacterium]
MKKLLSLALALVMVSAMCITSFAAMVDSGIDYTETLETIDNPGTGYTPGGWYTLGHSSLGTSFGTATVSPKFDLCMFSSCNDYTQAGSPSAFVNPTDMQLGFENKLIDDETLGELDAYFAAAEAKGVLVIPRFAYTWSDTVGCEPDDVNWIITHIEQISEVLNKYPKTVIAVEAGIIGPWGEMHSSKYQSTENMNIIIGAWVDNLDTDITILCRTAKFIINYIYSGNTGTQAERNALFMADLKAGNNPLAYRFGMYNDGYLGNAWDYGTWEYNGNPTRAEGIELLRIIAEYAPYGGEMAYCGLDQVQGTVQYGAPSPIYSDGFVKELYDTHLSYLMNIKSDTHLIKQELDKITFGENHAFDGMPDVSVYYGQTMQKFMLDHMGFRFVLREAKNDESANMGGTVRFEGKVENTGFGNILFSPVCEMILVGEDGQTVLSVDVDPKDFKSTETTAYALDLAIPEDMAKGEYTAYLRMGSASYADSADGAYSVRFANDGVWNETYGANYLGTFSVIDRAGDVNADGVVNVLDLQLAARYIAQRGVSGTYDLSAYDFAPADMDDNGVIDQLDLNLMADNI